MPFFDEGVLIIDVHKKLPKIRFLVWYIFWKLSLISLVKTSKCSPLEVLKPFYDCVNTNSVKITAYCAAKFRRCFFFQISNGWYLSNFNCWHFSYFDWWIFSQRNFTFIKTSPLITWLEVTKKYFTDHFSSVNWSPRVTEEAGLQLIQSHFYHYAVSLS